MNNHLVKRMIQFAFLLLLQVLVVNHIQVSSQVCPYIYILFILTLPFKTPGWVLLLSSFAMGLCMDVLSGTMGLHMAASVLVAFVRPFVLNLISFGKDYDPEETPSIRVLGADWFISYAAIFILIHHSTLFFFEVFRFDELGQTLRYILFSSMATFVLVMLSQFLSGKTRKA